VFGGTGGGKEARNDFYKLHLETEKWAPVVCDNAPPERFAHVALVHGDKIYVHGGNGGLGFLAKDDFYCFDLNSNKWEPIDSPNKPSARYHHSGVVCGKVMYIFGGCRSNKQYFNDLYSFNFESKTWTEMKPTLPPTMNPRAGHAMFCINNKIFVYGGVGGDGGYDYYQDMYALDLANPTEWIQVQLPPLEEHGVPHSGRPISCVTSSKYAYIFGGSDGKKPTGTMYRFDPKAAKFLLIPLWLQFDVSHIATTVTGSKGLEPTPRYGHCSVLDNSGNLTVYGGSGSMYLSDTIQISVQE